MNLDSLRAQAVFERGGMLKIPNLIRILSAIPLGISLWVFTSFVLSSHRGFEMTDESLYLLVAQQIAGTTQWGFPAGWHTSPLYLIAGQDVANFRTLGGVLLGIIGMLLGYVSHCLSSTDTRVGDEPWSPRDRVRAGVFVLVGYVGTLLYYSSLLRAPSYNWVNLAGLLLAAIGFLLVLNNSPTGRNPLISKTSLLHASIISFGLLFSLPGKPSSPVLFMAIASLVLGLLRGWRESAIFALQVTATSGVLVLIAITTRFWPLNFWVQFEQALSASPLTESRLVEIAVFELVGAPGSLLTAVFSNPVSAGLVVLTAVLAAFAFGVTVKLTAYRRAFLVAGWTLLVWEFAAKELAFSRSLSLGIWGRFDTGIALVLLYILSITHFFLLKRKDATGDRDVLQEKKVLLGSVLLAWTPFVFAFGSTNALLGQAAQGGAGFLLASLILLQNKSTLTGLSGEQLVLTVASIGAISLILLNSHENPYRLAPMAEQTVPILLSDQGSSQLYVDPSTATFFLNLQAELQTAGFNKGTPVVGLEWTWSSGIPYLIGASVPPSAMPTLFGYEGSLVRLEENLTRGCASFDCKSAWVIVSDQASLNDKARLQAGRAEGLFSVISGRNFPSDYQKVFDSDNVKIFKPVRGS
jgi:hypothetical protein